MGSRFTHPASSLTQFQNLFTRASWEMISPEAACLADAEDSRPEACFRREAYGQLLEVSLHLPLDQISVAVSDVQGKVTFKLFFFYRQNLPELIQVICDHPLPLRLNDLNELLLDSAPHCLFTLLELPGEGLFEVGPAKEAA